MNTTLTLDTLVNDVKSRLCRELEEREVQFLCWLFHQHTRENQVSGKRTGIMTG
jgi:hypothetical protein